MSYYMHNDNARLAGWRRSDEGIMVTRSIEIENKQSGTGSEASSPKGWEWWEKRDSKDKLVFVSFTSVELCKTWYANSQ
jgi:hypothetical protein